AGWDLDIAKLSPDHPESIRDEFIEARFHHQSSGFDHKPLAQVLAKAVTRRETELHREANTPQAAPSITDRFRRFPELAPDFELDTEPVRVGRHARQDDPQF
ncbi:MAG: hypothetical protein ABWX92_11820, partial [Mycetocola sp.]